MLYKNCQPPKSVIKKFKRMGIKANTPQPDKTFEEPFKTQLYEHLLNSELFSVYRTSFEQITGHTVTLIHPDIEKTPNKESQRCNNTYCNILRETKACSKRCMQHTLDLSFKTTKQSVTQACDGGLTSSLIAVTVQNKVVAYIRTGQVKLSTGAISIDKIKSLKENLPESIAADLHDEFEKMDSYDEKQYVNQLVVLGAFSLQLATVAEKAMDKNSPDSVLTDRCKNYISKHLNEKICLDALAEHTKVTNSYMCKQFKKHTGMTLVEYINHNRVDQAKALLIEKPAAKIIDIAYECGFQSLSQFNRTFQRFVSSSPTCYRKSAITCASGSCTRA